MSRSISFNGVSYVIPDIGEGGWGLVVTNFLEAISTGTLQKTGGSFTLLGEVDFGATFGLKVPYLRVGSDSADDGAIRLPNNVYISWRDKDDTTNKGITLNLNDKLSFSGENIALENSDSLNAMLPDQGSNAGKVLSTDGTDTEWISVLSSPMTTEGDIIYSSDNDGTPARLAVGTSGQVLVGGTTPSWGEISNSHVASDAAIAGSKVSPNFGSQNVITTGSVSARNIQTMTQLIITGSSGAQDIDFSSIVLGENQAGGLYLIAVDAPYTSGVNSKAVAFAAVTDIGGSVSTPLISTSTNPSYAINSISVVTDGSKRIIRVNATLAGSDAGVRVTATKLDAPLF